MPKFLPFLLLVSTCYPYLKDLCKKGKVRLEPPNFVLLLLGPVPKTYPSLLPQDRTQGKLSWTPEFTFKARMGPVLPTVQHGRKEIGRGEPSWMCGVSNGTPDECTSSH